MRMTIGRANTKLVPNEQHDEERQYAYDNPEKVLHFPFGESAQFITPSEVTTMAGKIKEGRVGLDGQVEPMEPSMMNINHFRSKQSSDKPKNNNIFEDNKFRNSQSGNRLFNIFDGIPAFEFKESKPENVVHTGGNGYIPKKPQPDFSKKVTPKIEL
ncbi:hypothetical protein PPL_10942 [Heterostelium album PN500]|uniref:Uncharacterized protein n=1 Tax=Heterostelium pallidum (strain ATCC 26659 / Pp 5 / PN500) TaxID=670386 RepID=D3BSH4_HETP5|nr:hypothetical protein PPL_10942 [Heterostelium album PN500]EFA75680.1 hypothetical protein PPL_10942 [Heterostelium album PN500]|eukprot:XP_020427814.1 hypothetical protein PPL_10942 [Heterostelium album PN500]